MNKWNLTDRENQVMHTLAMAGDGNSKRAAREIHISHRTVEEYVQRAMKKMGVDRRMAAILMWDRENRCCPDCFAARLTGTRHTEAAQ